MQRLRRLTAFLASLFYAQLLWAGSGFACAMPAGMSGAVHAPAATAGMDMSGGMAGMDAGMHMAGTTSHESGESPSHHHAPCDSPSPLGDCESMTPCAPLALASVEELPRAPHTVPSSVTALAVLVPPSQVSPPELPPPRA